MKKIIFSIILVVVFILISTTTSKALVGLSFSPFIGLSTPNDEIANVYNRDSIKNGDDIGKLIDKGIDMGYHIGFQLRMNASDLITLYGGISFNRFPKTNIEVLHPETNEQIAMLRTTTNIIPIFAGVNIHPFKIAIIEPYFTANLAYNHISSSIDIVKNDMSYPFETSPSDSRLGYGIGLGVNLDLKLLTLYLEGKFNHINLIGTESKESDKNYFGLSLGVAF